MIHTAISAAMLFLALVKATWALNAMDRATRRDTWRIHVIRAATFAVAVNAMWGLIAIIHGEWQPDGYTTFFICSATIRYLVDRRGNQQVRSHPPIRLVCK